MYEIQQLKRQGLNISQIAALTNLNRRTIRKYLAEPSTPRYGPRAPRPTKLHPFAAFITQRLQAGVWNAVVLCRELQEQGYTGSYSAVKRYLQPLRQAAQCVAVRRFETPPGQQAQVDWGELGTVETGGGKQTLSGFVMTLGYSRAMFLGIATDQKLPTLLQLHEEAFRALGGVPQEILYDWMKTVALGVDERGEPQWHPHFLDFARYWGFELRLCRAYRPQTKGKVENGIGYVRKNFLCGRTASDVPDLCAQAAAWTAQVAIQRVHGTTHRGIAQAWAEEQAALQPIGTRPPYPIRVDARRRVSRDGYVAYQTNRYPVPWRAAGQEVLVRAGEGFVEILQHGATLSRHRRCEGRHQTLTVPELHADIPLGAARAGGKARLVIREGEAPPVQQRLLAAYEALLEEAPAERLAGGGGE